MNPLYGLNFWPTVSQTSAIFYLLRSRIFYKKLSINLITSVKFFPELFAIKLPKKGINGIWYIATINKKDFKFPFFVEKQNNFPHLKNKESDSKERKLLN